MRFDGAAQLIGASAPIEDLRQEIDRVARTDAKVLITGESGAGKEVVARQVYALSTRSSRPFVAVNCAGLPETLLESELFGHVRGSFTGAYRDKPGKLEVADEGTIFMDEIGEMTLRMQGLLLRFLETGEIQKVGADRTGTRVDVRTIAATNRNLRDMIAQGQFREDLFYRLNVIHLIVPGLRERKEDIPGLVDHFMNRMSRTGGRPARTISPAAMQLLNEYHWPGNVRELQNVIERAVILSSGPVLRVPIEDLLPSPVQPRDGVPQTLEEAERAHILKILAETRWLLSGPRGAAARLGMNRSTLQFRMKKLGILRPTS
jgi:formate hydrogenlyase transcriptional activator